MRLRYYVLTGCLLLSGCSTVPPSDTSPRLETVMEQIKQLRETVPPPKPGLKRLPMKRSEAWLASTLAARYANLRADAALRLVAQNRPVRYNFSVAEAPLVKSGPPPQTIRRHLNTIAAQADWIYELHDGVVQVYDIETRHFVLSAQPGSTEARMGLRNLSAEQSASGGADNAMTLQLDPYTREIVASVEGVLGISGSGSDGDSGANNIDPRTRVTIAPSANLLVVTARPNAMRQVAMIMQQYNAAVSSIVRISLSLIEVEIEDAEKHELLINLLRASTSLPVSLILGATGSSAGAGPILPREAGLESTAGSRYVGSSVLAEWLQTFGNTSITYDDTIEVLNNHLASVDVTRSERYISKISREPVADSGGATSTEVEFELLRTGLALHLQPTVVDGRITLRLGMSRSTPVGRVPYEFGDVAGTNFITEDFNRMLAVSLIDGVPKLLSSFSQANSRDKRSRIPFLGPFGQGREQTLKRRETVMLITADVVQG